MSNLWESFTDTAKSLGGAAIAPYGAAWDLATAAFDDEDDNFGSLVNKVSGRGADMLDPILNEETLSGYAFTKTMQGLEYVYREGISEPIVTASTMLGHVAHKPVDNFEDIFSGRTWGAAYEVAQNRSIGQARLLSQQAMFDLATPGVELPTDQMDPLDERAYKQIHENQPFLTSLHSGTTDFAARWYLDPGVLLGKGAKVTRQAKTTRQITNSDFTGGTIMPRLFEEKHGVKPFDVFRRDSLGTRTEDYLRFVNEGADGKPLNGAQVYVATPELKRSAAGRQIASLIADAGKIEDPATRGMAQRKILAVAWGDVEEIGRAREELVQMGAVGDALKNIGKGNTLDLKTHALGAHIAANPVLMSSMQSQLDNLDDVGKFVDQHIAKLDTLLDTQDTLRYAPGVHAGGKRALAREEGRGLLRNGEAASGHAAFDKPVNWTLERSRRLAEHPAISSVYQKSQNHVPLKVITHTAKAVSRYGIAPYVKAPLKFSDAMRTSHLQGVVNTHDWNGAANQLDSMMKLTAVPAGKRMELLSKVQMARHEQDKVTLIHEVERASMRGLVDKYTAKTGRDIAEGQTLADFFEEVMAKGSAKRTSHLAALHGRAYAATKNADAEGRVDQITPRADLIDDVDGVPVALPLLETQGRNYVPLFDAVLADKMLGRDYGRMMRHAQAWKLAGRKVGELNAAKAATGKSVEKALHGWHAFMDHAVDAASLAMRTWKFSVLFRLGYPLRVVSDDHMRIWSQIGAMAVIAPLFKETTGNIWYNQSTRYRAAMKEANQAKVRLAAIDDMLTPEQVAAHAERAAEVTTLNRRIASGEWAGKRFEAAGDERAGTTMERANNLRTQRDVLMDAMGDDPTDLLREKARLEAFLDLSKKQQAQLTRKKRRGDKNVALKDGTEYPGAFGGDMGDAYRVASGSNATFDNLAKVGEEKLFKGTAGEGSWQVIHNDNPAHHDAWADVLNNQFRQSKVAMLFVKNDEATVDDFVRWIKKPEQRELRERLPQFAHDPEDWGWRVKQLVDDYLPTGELRGMVAKGRITPRKLDKMFADKSALPAVHGASVGHNLGMSKFATSVGSTMNRLYKFIGEMPTDALSRHPYFAAIYQSEVTRLHLRRKAFADSKGQTFGQADLDDVTRIARKNALADLQRTLFDISAHSNAAHAMRFISPFFAAHQEALARWWRIVADDPSVIRRFQQAFDAPRKLGLVVDQETGEPIKSGEMPGTKHQILFQMPEAWGGHSTDPNSPDYKVTDWRVNENSFNLILQNGIMNPGIGPIVAMPVEAVVQKYAQYEDLERVARLINPYPPESIGSMMLPATVRRVHSLIQQEESAEFARMMATNLQDKVVDFKLAHGNREPNQAELRRITSDAKDETMVEAWMRLGQNSLSPAPASPRSRYEVFRQGWRKINDQAEAEGHDYDWRIAKFRELYGEAYLPMIASSSNNIGNLDATNETIAALKANKGLISKVDPRFAGAIVGSAGAYQSAEDYSSTAGAWLKKNRPTPGESTTFSSYDDPLVAAQEAAVKRGWNKYGQAMDALTALAVENGLQHYSQSEQLMAVKRQIVAKIANDNMYWGEEYLDPNFNEYNTFLDDLKMIAQDRGMADRGDVKVLGKYLQVRDIFTAELERRDAAGGSKEPTAIANRELMGKFQDIVAVLTESNLDFESYFYNGIVERDPYLRQVF